MTPAEKLGYKVGDRFVDTDYEDGTFTGGSIIELYEDDGSDCPMFKLIDGHCYYNVEGFPSAFEELSCVRKIPDNPKKGDLFIVVDDSGGIFTQGSLVELAVECDDGTGLFRLIEGDCPRYPYVMESFTNREEEGVGCFCNLDRLSPIGNDGGISLDTHKHISVQSESEQKEVYAMKYLPSNLVRKAVEDAGSHFFTVEFDKADGSPRKMNARTGTNAGAKGGESTIADKPNLIGCKEMVGGKSQFRCFDVNRVRKIKSNGKVYEVK